MAARRTPSITRLLDVFPVEDVYGSVIVKCGQRFFNNNSETFFDCPAEFVLAFHNLHTSFVDPHMNFSFDKCINIVVSEHATSPVRISRECYFERDIVRCAYCTTVVGVIHRGTVYLNKIKFDGRCVNIRTLDGMLKDHPGVANVPRGIFTPNFNALDVLYPQHTPEIVKALQEHHHAFGKIVANDKIALPELEKYRLGLAPYLARMVEDFVFVSIFLFILFYFFFLCITFLTF